MLDAFNRHPAAVGESYGEHLTHAAAFGGAMVAAGLACLVHAIFPFWFEKTASVCVKRLHARMDARLRTPSVAFGDSSPRGGAPDSLRCSPSGGAVSKAD